MSFADSDDSDTETADADQHGRTEFLDQVLTEHPEWIRTATVTTKEGQILRLIHIESSSAIISYDETTREKFYLPLESPIVKGAKWVNGADKE